MAQVHPQIFTAREDISRLNNGLSLGLVETIQVTVEPDSSGHAAKQVAEQ